ncbi:WD40 repeat-like protein [Thelephora ganbajun]|uniref:WD40 repeat-like protein n=1 Tax=Thelephora ganbajun TaxID=370292 RepID=A0ACB6YYD2_THEGA|nr:WD40 repeat-like protein [Thelephora ganbajun]
MFFCGISGEPPQDSVVSSKSGHVYERRLIQKYITENGTDPLTGEKLEENDLITIKASPNTAPPRPPTHSSIPALLQTLQNEWDALVLETFTMKQQYNSIRQKLSYALYAQDAATRVVARVIRERDAAREALANVQASMGIAPSNANGPDVDMVDAGEDTGGLPAPVIQQIDETHQALSSIRKKRKAPADYVTPVQVKTFTAKHTIPSLHSSSPSGINSIALSKLNPNQFLTDGNDKIVQLYDRGTDKKVNHIALREREGEPTLLTSGNKTWSLHDLANFEPILHSPEADDSFSAMSIHPDGTLIGLGTPTSTIQIFDVRTGAVAASLTPDNTTPFTVNTLSFSENGYHLLAPNSTSSMAVWDLRKPKIAHSISLGDSFKVNEVLDDYSAQLLGVMGNEGARIYAHRSWEELIRFEEGGEVVDLAYGEQGQEIWGVSGRDVRIWGLSA